MIEELNKDYNTIKKEVSSLNKEIVSLINKNDKNKRRNSVKKLYKGVQILFSPLLENTDLLILGINPGAGYMNWKEKPVKKFSPLKQHEFITEHYTLAREIIEIFEGINKRDIFDKSVVSNYYYLATRNVGSLKQLKNELKGKMQNDIDAISAKWTLDLIKIVNPKYIFCEGFEVWKCFYNSELFQLTDINNNKTFRSGKINGIPFLACKRKYSNIQYKNYIKRKLVKDFNEFNI